MYIYIMYVYVERENIYIYIYVYMYVGVSIGFCSPDSPWHTAFMYIYQNSNVVLQCYDTIVLQHYGTIVLQTLVPPHYIVYNMVLASKYICHQAIYVRLESLPIYEQIQQYFQLHFVLKYKVSSKKQHLFSETPFIVQILVDK